MFGRLHHVYAAGGTEFCARGLSPQHTQGALRIPQGAEHVRDEYCHHETLLEVTALQGRGRQ